MSSKIVQNDCVATAIAYLAKQKPNFFLDQQILPIDYDTIFNHLVENVFAPEMKNYFLHGDQLPCSKEMLEKMIEGFVVKRPTISFYICTFERGAHEGGLRYQVTKNVLFLEKNVDNSVSLDINDYAFVLRTSRGKNGEIGAGHLMLVKTKPDILNDLIHGFPERGLN